MHHLSRRSAIATLVAVAGVVLRGREARADHDYMAVITNIQLGPDGASGMVGRTLIIEERPASPKFIEGCHGVFMPAFHVRVAHDGSQETRLLMGIDPIFHPDPLPRTRCGREIASWSRRPGAATAAMARACSLSIPRHLRRSARGLALERPDTG